MPSIQTASIPVTSFPNEFVSPWGNDEVIPLYSSVPLKTPVVGCLPCVVCGNSNTRYQIISGADQNQSGFLAGSQSGSQPILTISQPGIWFSGFITPSNKYQTAVLFDWDTCLFSAGILDYSETPLLADGNSLNSVPWLVDGHVKLKAVGEDVGEIIESTGGYASLYPVGTTLPISSIFNENNYPQIIDDTHRSLEGGPFCGNPTGAYVQCALY